MARVRVKVEAIPEKKMPEELKGRTISARDDLVVTPETAEALVKGGFADYLDDQGNVMSEAHGKKGTYPSPTNPQPSSGSTEDSMTEIHPDDGEISTPSEEEESSSKKGKRHGR